MINLLSADGTVRTGVLRPRQKLLQIYHITDACISKPCFSQLYSEKYNLIIYIWERVCYNRQVELHT